MSPASGADPPIIVLVTGTDTGVGKTWTGCALARAARGAGRRVVAIKPVETGCADDPDATEDGAMLARASGQLAPTRALLRFKAPLAPPEAADREGRRIDYEELVTEVKRDAKGADLTLVEGAGGLLSPLTWERTAVDLARDLGARVLVVAANQLGTINLTLMTLKVLAIHRLETLGVVLTAPERSGPSTASNAAAISRLASVRVHSVPRTMNPEECAGSMNEVLRWLQRLSR